MAEKTAIAWTRSTFNPWIGCTEISTAKSGGGGCDNCYARELDKRYKWGGATHWGAGVPRYRTSEHAWRQPLKWEKEAAIGDKPWRVFCASLADVFDNEVSALWRQDLWHLIVMTPNLSWLLVTKRIGNVRNMVPEHWLEQDFPTNVRLLITVCNQEEADRDIPKLLALPCKNGVSYEPALGAVDWRPWLSKRFKDADGPKRGIEWMICGGESTQGAGKARPFDLAWARSTIAQCKTAGVPCFIKQLGSQPYDSAAVHVPTDLLFIKHHAGADPAEWPEDLRVQEFPA